jgi:hypothetical protein
LLIGVIALPRAAVAEERERVNAVLAGDPLVIEKVLVALRASLDRQGLDLAAVGSARIDPIDVARCPLDLSPTGPVAHLWLDLTATQPTMYLLDPRSGLVYVRPLAVHPDPDAVELELIRLVVDSSVEAILKGRALGVSREEFERSLATPPAPAPAPAPEPTPAPSPASSPEPAARSPWSRWAITAGYSGTMLSKDFVAHGPELGAERRWLGLRLGVTLSQQLPQTVTRNEADMRMVSSGIRIVAAFPMAITSRLSASLGLGAGIDATHVDPSGTGAKPAFWATDPLVLAMTTIEHTFGALVVSAGIGVDLNLLATRYLVTHSSGDVVLWTPWRWRPFAALRFGSAF